MRNTVGGLKLGFSEQEKNGHSFSENFLPPCSFCSSYRAPALPFFCRYNYCKASQC